MSRFGIYPHRHAGLCLRCVPIFDNILTVENDSKHAREVMINQNSGEPRRKLLELRNHYIVVFLSESLEVIALEVESKGQGRAVRWVKEGCVSEFTIRNLGRSYANRDELIPAKGFDFDRLGADIEMSRSNFQPRIALAISTLQANKNGA